MNSIIVFGATSCIGSHFIDYVCADKDNQILAHVRNPHLFRNYLNKGKYPNISVVLGEQNEKMLCNLINRYNPTHIVNFAAISSVGACNNNIQEAITVNSTYVANILEAIKKQKPDCKFLNAGSEQERHEQNIYALSKHLAFNIVQYYRKNHNIFAVQPMIFPSISNRQRDNFFLPKFINGAIKYLKTGEKFKIGNLNITSSWADAQDIAEGCWKLLNINQAQDLWLAGKEIYTNEHLVHKVLKCLNIDNLEKVADIDESLIRKDEKDRVCPYDMRIMTYRKLGWESKIPLDNTIRSMVTCLNEKKV